MESELDGLEYIRQQYDQISARKRDGISSQNNWNKRGGRSPNNNHEEEDISEEGGYGADSQDPMYPTEEIAGQMTPHIINPIQIDEYKKNHSVKLSIKGVDIYFPFQPYDAQVEYMTKVIDALNGETNALLQSPTGTGKTLCLLCAALGWLDHYRRKFIENPSKQKDYKPVKILYSSRTHSQIKQVIKELKQTCYRPITCILGSRDQLCIKSDFTGVSGLQLNAACKQARASHISEQRCTYSDGYNKGKSGCISRHKNNVYDIEELATLAKKERFCPYFFERDLLDRADLTLLPYNYIMDGRVRGMMGIKLVGSILIFDEAHNIERVAEDGCSFTISMRDLENCELDFKLLKQKAKSDEEAKMSFEEIQMLEYPIMNMMKTMTRVKREMESEMRFGGKKKFGNFDDSQKGKIEPGREIFTIFKEWTKGDQERFGRVDQENPFRNGIDEFNIQEFMGLLMKTIEDLSNIPTSKGGLDNMAFAAITVANLLAMDRRIRSKGTNKDLSQNFIDSYILQTSFGEEENPIFGISLVCLHPGVGFDYIKETKPRNILLTSGTLAPLSSFQSELLVDFPIKLENSHVIDTKTQVYTAIMKKGPSGVPLNFSYDQRDNIATYKEMGNVLLNIARLVPNGVLVCFASYSLMNKCFDIWNNPDDDILTKIESLKTIHKEPKRGSQLGAVMEKYLKDAKSKGAILCCVCRGKVSEGIDFADEMARAVVVIGIPFPALGDQRVTYKKKYLNDNQRTSKRISGNEWYMQQTVRAVNQAIGRVIRHINDHGVVFLCDERFSRGDFTRDLPSWLKDNQEIIDKFGFMVGKVVTFFRDKKNNPSLNKLLGMQEKMKPIIVHEDGTTQAEAQPPHRGGALSEIFGNNLDFQREERSNSRSRQDFQRNERSNSRTTLYNPDPRSFGLQSQPVPAMPREKETPQSIYDSYREHQDAMALAMNNRQRSMFRGAVEGLRDIEDQQTGGMFAGMKKVKKEENKSPVQQVHKQNMLSQYFNSSQSPVSKEVVNSSPQQRTNPNPFRMVGMSNTQAPSFQTTRVLERIEVENSQGMHSLRPTASPVIVEQMSELSFGPRVLETRPNENSIMNALNTNVEAETETPQKAQPTGGSFSCVICYEGPEGRNFMTGQCGHVACQDCWTKWLGISDKCPTCRKPIKKKRLIRLHI